MHLRDAMLLMEDMKLEQLPVVEEDGKGNKKPIGILDTRNIRKNIQNKLIEMMGEKAS